ncbi:ROK family protein [Bacillus cihuensis]|uniref:ROK family protein n=1 Tax=Bacillus cihuensis TaxID=1208599 RepID=UPI000425024E|nr:ROK family protein [Bacillus cihuensis]
MKTAIGIDIGGTKIAIGVVQEDGNVLTTHEFPTEVENGPDYATDLIISCVKEFMQQFPTIRGIGIGAPGPLDSKQGIVLNPPNLKSWHSYPIVHKIDSVFRLPVRILNDADAAAFGEYFFTYRDTYKHVLYVTVSTGIGGGIIINESLYEGALSGAGEIGHSVIRPEGLVCGCGKQGCLETLASGTALSRIWKDRMAAEGKPVDPNWNSKDLFAQFHENDHIAQSVIEEATTHLAMGLSQAIQALNPELLILGGGVIIGQPVFYKMVSEKLPNYLLDQHSQLLKIEKASHGALAGVKGAAATILSKD